MEFSQKSLGKNSFFFIKLLHFENSCDKLLNKEIAGKFPLSCRSTAP
jgi:hypothetical protein